MSFEVCHKPCGRYSKYVEEGTLVRWEQIEFFDLNTKKGTCGTNLILHITLVIQSTLCNMLGRSAMGIEMQTSVDEKMDGTKYKVLSISPRNVAFVTLLYAKWKLIQQITLSKLSPLWDHYDIGMLFFSCDRAGQIWWVNG